MKRSPLFILFLFLCALILDPATAWTFSSLSVPSLTRNPYVVFEEQALADDPILSDHLPSVGRPIGCALRQWLGHSSRRRFIGVAGSAVILGGGAWLLQRNRDRRLTPIQPSQPTPATPASSITLAQAPRLILDFLDARQDLVPEVQEMLKRRMLPPGTVSNISEYQDTVREMRRILTLAVKDPARVLEIPDDEGAGFGVRVGEDRIEVNIKLLPHLLKENEEILLHEILHLTPSYQKMIIRANVPTAHLNRSLNILTHPDELQRRPDLQAEAWHVLRVHAVWERRSYFTQMALIDLKSELKGMTPLEFIVDALTPAAQEAGISIHNLVENARRQDSLLDPRVRALAAEYSFAGFYKRGNVNSINIRVGMALASASGLQTLSRSLIGLPPSSGGPRPGEEWVDWLARMLFSTAPRPRAEIDPAPPSRRPDPVRTAA